MWLVHILVYIVVCFLMFVLCKYLDGCFRSHKDKLVLLMLSYIPGVNLAIWLITIVESLDCQYPKKERWYW